MHDKSTFQKQKMVLINNSSSVTHSISLQCLYIPCMTMMKTKMGFNPFTAMKKNNSYARGILVKIKSFFPYVETVEMG